MNNCHPKHVVDNWLKDVDVQVWQVEKVIDFSMYGPNPTYPTNFIVKSQLLSAEVTVNNNIYIAKHQFENIDNWWPFTGTITGTFYTIDRTVHRP